MKEIWKDIEGYEGLYQVSNFGRVQSLDRVVNSKRGWSKFVKGRELRLAKHHYGYSQVSLLKNNRSKSAWVHSLVAKAFLPNPKGYPMINHIDEDKSNNLVTNLEWCDARHNARHGSCIARISMAQRNDPKKSLPVKQIDAISGEVLTVYPSIAEAARCTGIGENAIRCVVKHKPHCFTAGGYKWEKN